MMCGMIEVSEPFICTPPLSPLFLHPSNSPHSFSILSLLPFSFSLPSPPFSLSPPLFSFLSLLPFLPSLLFSLSSSSLSTCTDTKELSPHSQTSVVGPASVAGVKDGQDLRYDNEFVIAEVNADLKYYCETKGGKFEFAGSNMTLVSFS